MAVGGKRRLDESRRGDAVEEELTEDESRGGKSTLAALIELSPHDSEVCEGEQTGPRSHKISEQGRRETDGREEEAKRH